MFLLQKKNPTELSNEYTDVQLRTCFQCPLNVLTVYFEQINGFLVRVRKIGEGLECDNAILLKKTVNSVSIKVHNDLFKQFFKKIPTEYSYGSDVTSTR